MSMMMNRATTATLLGTLSLLGTGCGGPVPETDQTAAPLLGGVTYDPATCEAHDRAFLDETHRQMRQALSSRAFEQCVEQTMRSGFNGHGPYRECNDAVRGSADPFFGRPIAEQIAGAIAATRTMGNAQIQCDGANWLGTADAEIGSYYTTQSEAMRMHGNAFWVWSYASMRLRWDTHGIAGIIVHEALHQQGYSHDNCTNQPTYDLKQNSVPYILQWCLRDTLTKSNGCPSSLSCGPEGRAINRTTSSGSTCECVHDRDLNALGFIGFDLHGRFHQRLETVVSGRPLARPNGNVGFDHPSVFRYSPGGALAVGQFDGVGGQDLLVRDDRTGDLLVLAWSNGGFVAAGRWRVNTRVDRWLLWPSDDVSGVVGDFDGNDGRDEFIIEDAWGFAMVGLDAAGQFRTIRTWRHTENLGSSSAFPLASGDEVVMSGDFLIDPPSTSMGFGGDELLIQKANGTLVLLSVDDRDPTVPNHVWAPVSAVAGDRLGHWVIDVGNTFEAAGRIMHGDREQLVVRSGWGLGILDLQSVYEGYGCSTPTCKDDKSPVMLANGTQLGLHPWTLGAGDRIPDALVADYDADGRDELIIRDNWAFTMLENVAGTRFVLTTMRVNDQDQLGSWRYRVSDRLSAAGDFDGMGRAEIVISSDWGQGVLSYDPTTSRFVSADLRPSGGLIGDWSVPDQGNGDDLEVLGVADIDGDGTREMVLERINGRLMH